MIGYWALTKEKSEPGRTYLRTLFSPGTSVLEIHKSILIFLTSHARAAYFYNS